jgi:hypothetical protein
MVVNAGWAASLQNRCDHAWAVERPARSDGEWLVIALAEAAHHLRAVRSVADQPDEGDVEDTRDLLCHDGKELMRR